MSTPLGSSQLLKPRPFYPHSINQSLRFEDADSAYLTVKIHLLEIAEHGHLVPG